MAPDDGGWERETEDRKIALEAEKLWRRTGATQAVEKGSWVVACVMSAVTDAAVAAKRGYTS
jgi:hypothetical protein